MDTQFDSRTQLQQAMDKQRARVVADDSNVEPITRIIESQLTAPARPKLSVPADTRTAEQREAARQKWDAERRQEEINRVRNEREGIFKKLREEIGRKYADKPLTEWEFFGSAADQKKQRDVVDKATAFIETMTENIRSGRNLVAVGSRGTGKDFFLANCLRKAVLGCGQRPRWMNGANLFLALRDSMRSNAEVTEAQLISRMSDCQILALSDPMPPIGPLTEFQAGALLTVLDARYRGDRPTWVTLNVASRKEAEERMGALFVDRLFESAEVLFFDWGSYRVHSRAKAATANA